MAGKTTTQRGYGAAHQRERKRWESQVRSGLVDCVRCGQRIESGDQWDLGHTPDRTAWTGPEHATCNRSEGGTRGRAMQSGRTLRPW